MPTSNLICLDGKKIILDCGLGVTKGLVDQGMHLKDVSTIFISHLHSDHYIELGPLLHTAWTSGLKTKVDVWGPAGLDGYWDSFLCSMKDDIDLRIKDEGRPNLRDLVTIHVAGAGLVTQSEALTVTAIRTKHPPLTDTFAFSFKTEKKHVVFSGDTAPIPELAAFAIGADLLVHEAMLEAALPALLGRIGNGSEKLMNHWLRAHTFAHDAAKTAQNAEVKALALTHLIPADDPLFGDTEWQTAVRECWQGTLHVGRDGLRIPL